MKKHIPPEQHKDLQDKTKYMNRMKNFLNRKNIISR